MKDPDEYAKLVSEMDQTTGSFELLAKMARAYRDAMMRAGFEHHEALELTLVWWRHVNS